MGIQMKKVFIIAEAGVNHNGSIGMAKRLIDAASDAGADAVKFQTFKAEALVTKDTPLAGYQQKNLGERKPQQAMLKKLELKYNDFVAIKKYCDRKGIIFLSTAHCDDAIDFLDPLLPIFKIASGDLVNLPFLIKVAKKKKPIILSTGMASLNEVSEAVNAIRKEGNHKITLLHCTTNYPCPLEDVNLKAIVTLKKEFNLPVGYSDHTLGIEVSIAAVAMGACIIEKHFTLDKNMPGPDHKASLEPAELETLVKSIRNIEQAWGDGIKRPTSSEQEIKKLVRKSIIAKIDIPKGVKISNEMLAIKRPGIGLGPRAFPLVLGKMTRREIKQDSLIKLKDLR